MEFKVRDLRKNYFVVDDAYLNGYAKFCGIYATGVYVALCRHAGKEQSCFPSKLTMANKLGISERIVYTAIKELLKWDIIKIESQGRKEDGSYKSLTYYLLDKSQWKTKPSANGADGTKQHTPSANKDTTRRHHVPNKETHNKGTHIRKREEIEKLRKRLKEKKVIENNPAREMVKSILN